jgi:hypothetical protein
VSKVNKKGEIKESFCFWAKRAGRPDEFVKKIAQNMAQPILKIRALLLQWKKVARKCGVLLHTYM